MEYRVNFCWESNDIPPHNKHIVSIPWNDDVRNCFTKRDLEFIDFAKAQHAAPGIPIKHKSVIERIIKLYKKQGAPTADALSKLAECHDYIVAGDRQVEAWIESEDNLEIGHYEENNV